MEPFLFAIPLAAKTTPQQWEHLNGLLRATLTSALRQTDPDIHIMVAGHDLPKCIEELGDKRIEFLQVSFDPPKDPKKGVADFVRKRWAIASEYRKRGGGYFMFLDGDDFVHKDLVAYVRSDDNRIGYFISKGYALNYANRTFAPIPGAFRNGFHCYCGSSVVIHFRPKELPRKPFPSYLALLAPYFRFRGHHTVERLVWRGQRLTQVPFPAAIYNLFHPLNMSNSLERNAERQKALRDSLEKHRVEDATSIFSEFGIEFSG